uniref:Uncharacterized protein n=1 Tax=Cacopsylla melanoneura TaxID=428564 RepID=A0A8D9E7B3_9HEMI
MLLFHYLSDTIECSRVLEMLSYCSHHLLLCMYFVIGSSFCHKTCVFNQMLPDLGTSQGEKKINFGLFGHSKRQPRKDTIFVAHNHIRLGFEPATPAVPGRRSHK